MIDKKEASPYSIDTDASYRSTVLSRNERKKWDYLLQTTVFISKAASMKQDKYHVRALISHLKDNMTHLFDCSFLDHNVLINISTGMHTTDEVKSCPLNAFKNSKDHREAFVTRTFSEHKRKSLCSPISRSG